MLLEPRAAHALDLTTQEQTCDRWGSPRNQTSGHRLLLFIDRYHYDTRARNRWFLAYTLLNNPGLQKMRKNKMTDINNGSQQNTLEIETVTL